MSLIACAAQSICLTYGTAQREKQLSLRELLIISNCPEPAYTGLMQYAVQFRLNVMTYLFFFFYNIMQIIHFYLDTTYTGQSPASQY